MEQSDLSTQVEEFDQLFSKYKKAHGRAKLALFKQLDGLLAALNLPKKYRAEVISGKIPLNEGYPAVAVFPFSSDVYIERDRLPDYQSVLEGEDKDGYPLFVSRNKTGGRADDYLLPFDHPEYKPVSQEEIDFWRTKNKV